MSEPASLLVFARTPSRLRRTPLHAFAARLMHEVTGVRPFTCLLTSDDEIRALNKIWRGKDEPTDVLSFPAAPLPHALAATSPKAPAATSPRTLAAPLPKALAAVLPAPSLGDLAISCQRARLQAKENGHTLEEEIAILMLHGVLHLMGMDHETDQGRMRRAETRWRRKLGLPAGLIERAASRAR